MPEHPTALVLDCTVVFYGPVYFSADLSRHDSPSVLRYCSTMTLASYIAHRWCHRFCHSLYLTLGGKRVFSGHKIAREPANQGPVFSRLYGKSKRGKIGHKSTNSLRDWRMVSVFIQFSLCENRWNTGPSLAGFLSVFGQLKSLLPPCVRGI